MIFDVALDIDGNVFNRAYYDYIYEEKGLQIYFGGSSSGKSVFMAQRTVLDVFGGGRNYLCIRNVKTTIKNSMFNEICKAILQFNLAPYFKINGSDLVITCLVNGYQILFAGLDDVEKVKSITPRKNVITDIWVEEATEIQLADLKQLQRRLRGRSKYPKRVALSFNPVVKSHWIFEEFFSHWDDSKDVYETEDISILKTTYKDNLRFLEKRDIKLLENETDKYFHDVYTLGNWGVLGNIIYKNWEMRDLDSEVVEIITKKGTEYMPLLDTFDNHINGLDFGFSSDQAAVVRTHYDIKHHTIYIIDELYELELGNNILAEKVIEMVGKEYIPCDNNESKSIRELQQLGVNALTSRKGKDSVNFGINWLQRQKIVINKHCQHFKNEIQQYKWREDKDGVVLTEPVKKHDHLLDALRYAYEDTMEYRVVKAVDGF